MNLTYTVKFTPTPKGYAFRGYGLGTVVIEGSKADQEFAFDIMAEFGYEVRWTSNHLLNLLKGGYVGEFSIEYPTKGLGEVTVRDLILEI